MLIATRGFFGFENNQIPVVINTNERFTWRHVVRICRGVARDRISKFIRM